MPDHPRFRCCSHRRQLREYAGTNLSDLVLFGCERDGQRIGGLYVGPVDVPLVFITDGQYTNAAGDERFAFRAGSTYFRHGAKSEPGTSDDLRQFLDRRIEAIRESWLSGIRQVVEAPAGTQFRMVVPGGEAGAEIGKVSIVADDSGDPHKLIHPDDGHPLYQLDVIRLVNERLAPDFQIDRGMCGTFGKSTAPTKNRTTSTRASCPVRARNSLTLSLSG